MKTKSKQQLTHSESGFAAILVTMVIMIVISLIVLGFAQVSRREQRQSLDRQLNTQAFYAAETGINDAVTFVKANAAAIGTNSKTICATPTPVGTDAPYDTMPATSVLDAATRVSYTCLLIDPAPTTQQYRDVSDSSIVIPIKSASGTPIKKITFTWQPPAGQTGDATGCPPLGTLPQLTAWNSVPNPCTFGLARMDLVSTDGTFDRTQLSQQTMSGFFVPHASGSGNTNFKPNSTGTPPAIDVLYDADCGTSICTENINNLNSPQYQMRMRFMYQQTSLLEIRAYDTSGNILRISGNQIIVDATGKANDVLRRLQVRVPVLQSAVVPDYAIQSTDSICKQFTIAPNVDTGQGPGIPGAGPDAKNVQLSDIADSDCWKYGY